MKINSILLVLLILSVSCKTQEKETKFEWNLEKEKIHNKNRNDSIKWGLKNWRNDTKNLTVTGNPIINGVFPVPKYELTDSTFNGLGNWGDWNGLQLEDKKIIYHSLFVNKNAVNREFIKDKPNEVFFAILVLTDSIDLKQYSHTNIHVSSRNHPHYAGQGFVRTKSNRIDFLSFLTADRNNYAVVNMRLFDLRIGRIVLIAPQKDGSFRSLQLDAPIMSNEEMDKHIKTLIANNKEVINFFTREGTI